MPGMAINLDRIIGELPRRRREKIEKHASNLATLNDLHLAVELTQDENDTE